MNMVRLVKLIMWFIILFAIVAAVCVITVIVTVLRKNQSEADKHKHIGACTKQK